MLLTLMSNLGMFGTSPAPSPTAAHLGGDDVPRRLSKEDRARFKKAEERRRKAWEAQREQDEGLSAEVGKLYRKLTGTETAADLAEQAEALIVAHPEAERTIAEYGLFVANEQQPMFTRAELEEIQAKAIRLVMEARERLRARQDEDDVAQLLTIIP